MSESRFPKGSRFNELEGHPHEEDYTKYSRSSFDDIITSATQLIEQGRKVNAEYFSLVTNCERKPEDEIKVKRKAEGGRVYLNWNIPKDKTSVNEEVGSGVGQRQYSLDLVDAGKSNLEYWEKGSGSKKGNDQILFGDKKIIDGFYLRAYENQPFDVNEYTKDLINRINANTTWQDYWKKLLDHAQESDRKNIMDAYSASVKGLVYAIACESFDVLTKNTNDGVYLGAKLRGVLAGFSILGPGTPLDHPEWLKNYQPSAAMDPPDPSQRESTAGINAALSGSPNTALDQWVKKNRPFSSTRVGDEYIEKLKEFRIELSKTFGGDLGATKKYLEGLDRKHMSSRASQRLDVIMGQIEKKIEAQKQPVEKVQPQAVAADKIRLTPRSLIKFAIKLGNELSTFFSPKAKQKVTQEEEKPTTLPQANKHSGK